jgi:flagellar biosynthesis/type III secretory pathway protein FliH
MKRLFLVPVLGLATLAAATPARAQSAGWIGSARPAYADGDRQSYYDSRRAAYDNGYREGVKQGEKDGRKNQVFRYEDERAFQRADSGYHREFGDIERYRQSFRSGYTNGYSEGYQRYGIARGGYSNGRPLPGPYYPNSRGNQYPQSYPDSRGYGYPSYPGTNRGYGDIAFQNGLNDGHEKGAEDARKNRSFDPLRHDWYRSGDRHYNGNYGSRQQYKDAYRSGFQQGYDRGYRERQYR